MILEAEGRFTIESPDAEYQEKTIYKTTMKKLFRKFSQLSLLEVAAIAGISADIVMVIFTGLTLHFQMTGGDILLYYIYPHCV